MVRGMAFRVPSSRFLRERCDRGSGPPSWTWGCGGGLAAVAAGSLIVCGAIGARGQDGAPRGTAAVLTQTVDEACRVSPKTDCALSVALSASPDVVLVGQRIGVTMTVTNATETEMRAVTPSIISTGGSGGATLMTGPIPAWATIPAKGSHAFAFTFLATDAGTIMFRGSAEGVQGGATRAVRSREVTSNPLMAQLPILTTALSASPETPHPGQALTMTLTITNTGRTTIIGVAPSLLLRSDPAFATLLRGPAAGAVSLASGTSHSFPFTFRVNEAGPLNFAGGAVGTDTETGKPVAAPEASSMLIAVVPDSLTAALVASPIAVDLNQTITLTMTLENRGNHPLHAVVPTPVTVSSPASVKLSSGPTPVSAMIAHGATQSFTFVYRVTRPGTLTFAGGAVGTDSVSKAAVKSPKATSNPVTVTPPAVADDSLLALQDLQAAWPAGSEAESGDRSANSPPFGYLMAPRSEAKVGGIVPIVGGAFDKEDRSLLVTIILDGAPLGSLIATTGPLLIAGSQGVGSADYSAFFFDWDTTTTTPGPHTLAIQATDSQGESTIFGTRTVTVVGPNSPPVGFLDLPFPDATIGGTITVAGWAVDKEDPAIALTILLDGTALGTPAPTERAELETVFQSIPWAKHSGFTYGWDTSATPPGQHTLAIQATDSQGESTIFGTRTVTVTGSSNSPPFGFFVPPPAVARLGTTVPLVGTASDREDAGVTVALLLDGIPIGAPVAVPANGEFQFRWDTTSTALGTHTLAIEATDSEGASAIIGIRRVTLIR